MNGYIKLHRQLLDNEFWTREKFTEGQAWVDLLFLAAYKPQILKVRGIKFTLNSGELIWSQKRLAERWRWGNKRVASFLRELQKTGQISQKQHHRITVTIIVNWAKYQGVDTTSNTTNDTTNNTLTKKVKKDNNKHSSKIAVERNNEQEITEENANKLILAEMKANILKGKKIVKSQNSKITQWQDRAAYQCERLKISQPDRPRLFNLFKTYQSDLDYIERLCNLALSSKNPIAKILWQYGQDKKRSKEAKRSASHGTLNTLGGV